MYTTSNTANSSSIMGPAGLPESAFGNIRVPAPNWALKRPNYILINQSGSYCFKMNNNTGTDIEGQHVDVDSGSNFNWSTPDAVLDTKAGVITYPMKLDIQPIAWSSGSVGAAIFSRVTGPGKGSVTFVYKGGL